MRSLLFILASTVMLAGQPPLLAMDPYSGNDPFWILIHEPAVIAELKLSPSQRTAYQKLTDGLDQQFFPLRNKTYEQASAGMTKILAEARQGLQDLLKPEQHQRLNEILYQKLGAPMLLRDEVAEQIRLTEKQRSEIKTIVEDTYKAVSALEKAASEGEPREPLEKQYRELKTDEQTEIIKLLSRDQQQRWKAVVGAPFTLSQLGQPAIKAPELVDTGEWINSNPLQIANLRGKVVVVHFYTCVCSNCIHNYPSYRNLQQHFADSEVVMIGIHTPEVEVDRDVNFVRQKTTEQKLTFPILIDNDKSNWNAWGNSMWPSVYVLDKQGYLRHFWPGELQWQGNDGEKIVRERIEHLLAE
jgi:peroxiredoxin